MKNILVPTNFSKNCDKAAQLGIAMAKLYDAEIHFFHLLNTPVDWVKLGKENEKRYPETLKQIGVAQSALRRLEQKAENENLKCRTFLEYSVNQTNILKHSGHFHHDFIITGSSGTKGTARELFGSNVEKIIRKSDVPVIVVKENEVSFPFKNIVFVSDFVEDVSAAFEHVISIAKKCNAHIRLLRINTQTDTNSVTAGLNPIKKFLEKYPVLKNYSMYVNNEPSVEMGINTFLIHEPTDLIAMSTHGSTGFFNLFSKSIAEDVANHSAFPVMTIKI